MLTEILTGVFAALVTTVCLVLVVSKGIARADRQTAQRPTGGVSCGVCPATVPNREEFRRHVRDDHNLYLQGADLDAVMEAPE